MWTGKFYAHSKLRQMVRIFKTDVYTQRRILQLTEKLDDMLWFARWNFDLEDRDSILRVEYSSGIDIALEDNLRAIGVLCVELE